MTFIYPNEAFYVINNLAPRADLIGSNFNFLIGLEKDFALKAYNKELSKGVYERINENAIEIIKSLGEKSKYIKTPCELVTNKKGNLTTLLRWCCVPGDSCELGIDGSDFDLIRENRFNSNMLIYGSHNIDNRTQAYSLLAIWIDWTNIAFALTRKE